MDKDIPPLGGVRSKRYTMLVEDNVVKKVFEEPDGTGLTCSLHDNVLKNLWIYFSDKTFNQTKNIIYYILVRVLISN